MQLGIYWICLKKTNKTKQKNKTKQNKNKQTKKKELRGLHEPSLQLQKNFR